MSISSNFLYRYTSKLVSVLGDPPASSVVRVTYLPAEESRDSRCAERSTVEDVVGESFVVFVNRSATVIHGQMTTYVAEVLPETHSQHAVDTVVAHACDDCSKFTSNLSVLIGKDNFDVSLMAY